MEITKIQRQGTLELAIEAIEQYIIGNSLKVGDSLPSEPELAKSLGISRNILREALRHYRTLGIIESKPKIGNYIARLAPENPYQGYMPFIGSDENTLLELAEVRICLETGAAALIAMRATAGQLEELKVIAGKLAKAKSREAQIELETEFHCALLRIPGNNIINGLIPLLIEFFNKLRRAQESLVKPHPREQVNAEHQAMIDAIAGRDGVELARLLSIHGQDYLVNR